MTAPIDPVTVASQAGFKRSGWRKHGKGPWSGWVELDGVEITIEELASSWRAQQNGSAVSAPSLELLLTKLRPSTRRKR